MSNIFLKEVSEIGKKRKQNESARPFEDGADDTFRNYMARKIELQRKQFGQFNEESKYIYNSSFKNESSKRPHHQTSSSSNEEKDDRTHPSLFFRGIVVLVNGYTNPDACTIMRLMHKHGGDLEKYETNRVTHIIAENLSEAKALIYKRQRNPIPVVLPAWITDSVRQGKLIPHAKYLVREVTDKNTTRLESYTSRISDKSTSKKSTTMKIRTVGTDPTFLESYFSTSRLSFIGSFKQRMKHGTTDANRQMNSSTSSTTVNRVVFHIDMDCFFASVVLRNYPQYRDSPVAIGHCWQQVRDNKASTKRSTSELSTCNYVARKYGVRKGMFLQQAKSLCPGLIVLPYDYDGFEEVSNQVSDILLHYSDLYNGSFEQLSCDEAYLELWLENSDEKEEYFKKIEFIAENFRSRIFEETKCTASIGCASNKFLSKLATDRIKPDGLYVVRDWKELLRGLKLRDLPGIGHKLEHKLFEKNIRTVRDVWNLGETNAQQVLCGIIGNANGKKIYEFCHGQDSRPVQIMKRKTIGAECNYGVRFDGPYGVEHMIMGLAKEVEKRMKGVGVSGKFVTLKIKQRKQGAKEPPKYNGHGACDNFSKSSEVPFGAYTSDSKTINEVACKLFRAISPVEKEIRGMGVVMSKLIESNQESSLMRSLLDVANDLKEALNKPTFVQCNNEANKNAALAVGFNNHSNTLVVPDLSQIDVDVKNSLPADIQSEIDETICKEMRKRKKDEFGTSPEVLDEKSSCGEEIQKESVHLSPQVDAKSLTMRTLHKYGVPVAFHNHLRKETFQSCDNCNKSRVSEYCDKPFLSPGSRHNDSSPEAHQSVCDDNISVNSEQKFYENKTVKRRLNPTMKNDNKKRKQKNSDGKCQLSVKRMFKLVAVKNGQDQLACLDKDERVSLTQLAALPLEMQLQIANNDNDPIGLIKPFKNRRYDRNHCSNSCSVLRERNDSKANACTVDMKGEESNHSNSNGSEALIDDRDTDIGDDHFEPDFNFKYNLLPLNDWLDSVPIPNETYIEKLKHFFLIILDEGRPHDAVTMLRLIKCRDDLWSKYPFEVLVETVNKDVYSRTKKFLDLDWLGLHATTASTDKI